MKAKENMIIKAMRMQAEAIMNNKENSWIDSPEKLMIATIYNMAKGGIIDKMMN